MLAGLGSMIDDHLDPRLAQGVDDAVYGRSRPHALDRCAAVEHARPGVQAHRAPFTRAASAADAMANPVDRVSQVQTPRAPPQVVTEILERLRVQHVSALQASQLVDELVRSTVGVEVIDELLERMHGFPPEASP